MKSRLPLLLIVLALSLSACPQLPAPSGCTPHAYRCAPNPAAEAAGDHPEVCSASQRWTRIGDVGCQAIPPGTARCVVEEGLAFCATPAPVAPAPVAPTPSVSRLGPTPTPGLFARTVASVGHAVTFAGHAVQSARPSLSF